MVQQGYVHGEQNKINKSCVRPTLTYTIQQKQEPKPSKPGTYDKSKV